MNDQRVKPRSDDEFDVVGEPVEVWPACDAEVADRFLGGFAAGEAILLRRDVGAAARWPAEPVDAIAGERGAGQLRETLRTLRMLVADTPAAWSRAGHVAMSREMIVRLIDEALESDPG